MTYYYLLLLYIYIKNNSIPEGNWWEMNIKPARLVYSASAYNSTHPNFDDLKSSRKPAATQSKRSELIISSVLGFFGTCLILRITGGYRKLGISKVVDDGKTIQDRYWDIENNKRRKEKNWFVFEILWITISEAKLIFSLNTKSDCRGTATSWTSGDDQVWEITY